MATSTFHRVYFSQLNKYCSFHGTSHSYGIYFLLINFPLTCTNLGGRLLCVIQHKLRFDDLSMLTVQQTTSLNSKLLSLLLPKKTSFHYQRSTNLRLVLPDTPVQPVKPFAPPMPNCPDCPEGPIGPVKPRTPCAPRNPPNPVDPVAPWMPVAPVLPAGPMAPRRPSDPASPT